MTDRFEIFVRDLIRRTESPQGFNHPIVAWSGSDWMVALVGEVGEAANILKKMNRIRDGIKNKKAEDLPELLEKFRGEMGDALAYMVLIAAKYEFDLLAAARDKYLAVSKEIGYEEPIRPFKDCNVVPDPDLKLQGQASFLDIPHVEGEV